MNHPLAGCDLNFVGEVTESRPATNEELVRNRTHDERRRMQLADAIAVVTVAAADAAITIMKDVDDGCSH